MFCALIILGLVMLLIGWLEKGNPKPMPQQFSPEWYDQQVLLKAKFEQYMLTHPSRTMTGRDNETL